MTFDELNISAIFVSAKPASSDPLSDREYLAIKFGGGIGVLVEDGLEQTLISLRDELAARCETALREAVAKEEGA